MFLPGSISWAGGQTPSLSAGSLLHSSHAWYFDWLQSFPANDLFQVLAAFPCRFLIELPPGIKPPRDFFTYYLQHIIPVYNVSLHHDELKSKRYGPGRVILDGCAKLGLPTHAAVYG